MYNQEKLKPVVRPSSPQLPEPNLTETEIIEREIETKPNDKIQYVLAKQDDTHRKDKEEEQFEEPSPRRWIILLTFVVFTFGNTMAFITYSPVGSIAKNYYSVDQTSLLQTNDVFMYCFLALAFPVSWITNKHFRYSMIFSFTWQAIGGWIRYGSGHTFGGALLGQILIASVDSFTLPTPAYIAHTWFPAKEHTFCLMVTTFSNFLGIGVGSVMSAVMVTNDTSIDKFSGLETTMLVEAIILSIPVIPCLLFFKDRPDRKIANGKKAEVKEDTEYWSWVFRIVKNWRLFIGASALGMGYGLGLTLLAAMGSLLPSSDTPVDLSINSFLFIISGVFFGVISQILLAMGIAKGHYDIIVKFFFFESWITVLITAIIMKPDSSDAVTYGLNIIAGFGLIAFVPFGVESIIQLAHPAPDNIPATWIFWWGQIWAIIATNLVTVASDDFRLWILLIMLTPASLWIVFVYRNNNPGKSEESKTGKTLSLTEIHSHHSKEEHGDILSKVHDTHEMNHDTGHI